MGAVRHDTTRHDTVQRPLTWQIEIENVSIFRLVVLCRIWCIRAFNLLQNLAMRQLKWFVDCLFHWSSSNLAILSHTDRFFKAMKQLSSQMSYNVLQFSYSWFLTFNLPRNIFFKCTNPPIDAKSCIDLPWNISSIKWSIQHHNLVHYMGLLC